MNLVCPFERLLVSGARHCRRARPVTRREGAGMDCDEAEARARCGRLLERFEEAGAAAFGELEDRTQVPHSVLMKVQLGGFAGVAESLGCGADDLDELAAAAAPELDRLDTEKLAQAMRRAGGLRRRERRQR